MLARMRPAQFEELLIDDSIRPWGRVEEVLSAGFATLINELRGYLHEKPDLLPIDKFLPKVDDDNDDAEPHTGSSFVSTMRQRILKK